MIRFVVAPDPTLSDAEAAARRDFTINALFYDMATRSVIDYTGGLDHLRHRRIDLRFQFARIGFVMGIEMGADLGGDGKARRQDAAGCFGCHAKTELVQMRHGERAFAEIRIAFTMGAAASDVKKRIRALIAECVSVWCVADTK